MDTNRILAIFAHPDDEYTFSGLITKLINSNNEVAFICATKGEAGRIRNKQFGLKIEEEISKIREREFIRSCEHLKIHKYYFLDLIDGESLKWNKEESVEKIIDISKSFNPTHLISFDKYGGNGHPDHKEISNITHEVQKRIKSTELIQVTKYPSSFAKTKLWWLPKKAKTKVTSKICRNDLDSYKLIKLNKQELKAKMKLIEIYKSQFPDEKNKYFGQPMALLKLFGKYECYEIGSESILKNI